MRALGLTQILGQPCEFQVKGEFAFDIAEALWINETAVRKSGLRRQGGGSRVFLTIFLPMDIFLPPFIRFYDAIWRSPTGFTIVLTPLTP